MENEKKIVMLCFDKARNKLFSSVYASVCHCHVGFYFVHKYSLLAESHNQNREAEKSKPRSCLFALQTKPDWEIKSIRTEKLNQVWQTDYLKPEAWRG